MQNRRSFLASIALLTAGLPFAGWGGRQLAVQRYGKFFLVNGWILTAEDVEALESMLLDADEGGRAHFARRFDVVSSAPVRPALAGAVICAPAG